MTLRIEYSAALIDEIGIIFDLEFSDEEWYCGQGCLEVALDALNDRGWFPSPFDDGYMIGFPVYDSSRRSPLHPDDTALWVAFPHDAELPEHPAYGNEIGCASCGAHVEIATR